MSNPNLARRTRPVIEFAGVNITNLVLALAEEQCELISFEENDETLESYYVNLIGGDAHE